ncbi:unnamed protein product [Effrenium voratum]|nr:unnamed protein product [Effrenium voratum]
MDGVSVRVRNLAGNVVQHHAFRHDAKVADVAKQAKKLAQADEGVKLLQQGEVLFPGRKLLELKDGCKHLDLQVMYSAGERRRMCSWCRQKSTSSDSNVCSRSEFDDYYQIPRIMTKCPKRSAHWVCREHLDEEGHICPSCQESVDIETCSWTSCVARSSACMGPVSSDAMATEDFLEHLLPKKTELLVRIAEVGNGKTAKSALKECIDVLGAAALTYECKAEVGGFRAVVKLSMAGKEGLEWRGPPEGRKQEAEQAVALRALDEMKRMLLGRDGPAAGRMQEAENAFAPRVLDEMKGMLLGEEAASLRTHSRAAPSMTPDEHCQTPMRQEHAGDWQAFCVLVSVRCKHLYGICIKQTHKKWFALQSLSFGNPWLRILLKCEERFDLSSDVTAIFKEQRLRTPGELLELSREDIDILCKELPVGDRPRLREAVRRLRQAKYSECN